MAEERKAELDVHASAMAALMVTMQMLKGLIAKGVLTSDEGVSIVAEAIEGVHSEQRESIRAVIKTIFPSLPV